MTPLLRRRPSKVLGLPSVLLLLLAGYTLAAPGAMAKVNVGTVAGHAAEDAVVATPAEQRTMERHTRSLSAVQSAVAEAALPDTNPHDVGQWGPLVSWPLVAIHAALLPNGKVLAYASMGDNATESYTAQDHSEATVWDPVTGTQTNVEYTGFNIFCSGLAHLFDGRLFIAGGNLDQNLDGLNKTNIFDPATNTWIPGPDMAAGRWYPTVTPLRNGEMLITSGREVTTTDDTPEVYTPSTNSLRELTGATVTLPLYPWIDVGPDGRPFYLGPDTHMKEFDTSGAGSWEFVAERDTTTRDYGGHALYDIGKELVAGGGPSTASALVVDINKPTPTITPTQPMAFGRRQFNLTILADGSVLATGGNSSGAQLVDLNAGVYNAEQWNPATGQWRTLAAERETRQYHSIALLLPDGRVLSAGGGVCTICDQVGYLAKDAQIFSPPYLFNPDGTPATRPTINSAPDSTNYGAQFSIGTANPGSISKVALVRIGAVTHSTNMDQRYVPLSFQAASNGLTATAPADANIAPPGVYMLFIVNSNGVPSVAHMVGVGNSPLDTTPPTVSSVTPADGSNGAPGSTSVTATFSEPVNPDTVTAGSFTLLDPSGHTLPATVSATGSTATLTPSAPLAVGTSYMATLAGGEAGIEDRAGNALARDYVWSFTTASPDSAGPPAPAPVSSPGDQTPTSTTVVTPPPTTSVVIDKALALRSASRATKKRFPKAKKLKISCRKVTSSKFSCSARFVVKKQRYTARVLVMARGSLILTSASVRKVNG